MDWLMQYCPLEHLEDIIDKSFKEGQEHEKNNALDLDMYNGKKSAKGT